MDRDTAKELLQLSDKALNDIGIKANRDVIRHYAKGGTVGRERIRDKHLSSRIRDHNPSFLSSTYKVMGRKINVLGIDVRVPHTPLKDLSPVRALQQIYIVDIYSDCKVKSMTTRNFLNSKPGLLQVWPFMDEVIMSASKLNLLYACKGSAEIVADAIKDAYFGDTE